MLTIENLLTCVVIVIVDVPEVIKCQSTQKTYNHLSYELNSASLKPLPTLRCKAKLCITSVYACKPVPSYAF